MNNLLVVLDILTVSGVVVCAIIASSCKKLLSSVVALGATGIFAAASFLVMRGRRRRGAQPAHIHRHSQKDKRRRRQMKKFLTWVSMGVLLFVVS